MPGIAGLGLASKMVYDHLEENDKHMRGLRTYFVRELAKMDQVVVHGPQGEEAAPQIVSAAFVGVRSEVLLHTLEEEVSTYPPEVPALRTKEVEVLH